MPAALTAWLLAAGGRTVRLEAEQGWLAKDVQGPPRGALQTQNIEVILESPQINKDAVLTNHHAIAKLHAHA